MPEGIDYERLNLAQFECSLMLAANRIVPHMAVLGRGRPNEPLNWFPAALPPRFQQRANSWSERYQPTSSLGFPMRDLQGSVTLSSQPKIFPPQPKAFLGAQARVY